MIIKNLMSTDPVCIDKDQNVCDALRLMGKRDVSRLIVINTNSDHEQRCRDVAKHLRGNMII